MCRIGIAANIHSFWIRHMSWGLFLIDMQSSHFYSFSDVCLYLILSEFHSQQQVHWKIPGVLVEYWIFVVLTVLDFSLLSDNACIKIYFAKPPCRPDHGDVSALPLCTITWSKPGYDFTRHFHNRHSIFLKFDIPCLCHHLRRQILIYVAYFSLLLLLCCIDIVLFWIVL